MTFLTLTFFILSKNSSQGFCVTPTNYTGMDSPTNVFGVLGGLNIGKSLFWILGSFIPTFSLEDCSFTALKIGWQFQHFPKVLNKNQLDLWYLPENLYPRKSHHILPKRHLQGLVLTWKFGKVSKILQKLCYGHDPNYCVKLIQK